MGNLVIVAIPEEQDRVWKISSEKIPHLTLLFLGDADSNPNIQQVMEFVQHAVDVTEHGQFYLDVDRRGVLGSDEADVVFFSKRSWNLKWIKQFRSQLLQNDAIRTAYDSTEQYPEWTPHLTLGYPTAPANELDGAFDHPIYSVCFDRIAVWTGDFDGPEFRLEWPDRELSDDLAVAYSGTGKSAVDELLHVGVKGMRWGQRKTEAVTVNGRSKMVTPKKAAKLDATWAKNQYKLPKAIERHNGMAEHFNARIGGVNDKYKNDDFSKEAHDEPSKWSSRYKQYNAEVSKLSEDGYRHAVSQEGLSPTGKQKTTVEQKGDHLAVVIKNVDAKHAAIEDGDEVFTFTITRNARGLIAKAEPIENTMAQTESFVDDYLVHYGVKGMHWGSRKSSEVTPTSVAVKTTPHDRKTTKVEVKGGSGHDAHPDAIKVAAARQKLRKSGSAALSNKELKDVANRLQLESNVARLEGERKSGSTFVGKLLRRHGSQQLDRGINRAAGQVTDEAATQVGRAATRKIFKAGVTAAL